MTIRANPATPAVYVVFGFTPDGVTYRLLKGTLSREDAERFSSLIDRVAGRTATFICTVSWEDLKNTATLFEGREAIAPGGAS